MKKETKGKSSEIKVEPYILTEEKKESKEFDEVELLYQRIYKLQEENKNLKATIETLEKGFEVLIPAKKSTKESNPRGCSYDCYDCLDGSFCYSD